MCPTPPASQPTRGPGQPADPRPSKRSGCGWRQDAPPRHAAPPAAAVTVQPCMPPSIKAIPFPIHDTTRSRPPGGILDDKQRSLAAWFDHPKMMPPPPRLAAAHIGNSWLRPLLGQSIHSAQKSKEGVLPSLPARRSASCSCCCLGFSITRWKNPSHVTSVSVCVKCGAATPSSQSARCPPAMHAPRGSLVFVPFSALPRFDTFFAR